MEATFESIVAFAIENEEVAFELYKKMREESAVKMYNDMAAKITDPKLEKVLKFMAQEEAKHKLRLETEYDQNILGED